MDTIFTTIISILLVPLQLVLIPIDALLAQIPGLSAVPDAINAVVGFIGVLPATFVHLLGINPLLWNAIFITFLLYVSIAPGIQIIKKIIAWVRP